MTFQVPVKLVQRSTTKHSSCLGASPTPTCEVGTTCSTAVVTELLQLHPLWVRYLRTHHNQPFLAYDNTMTCHRVRGAFEVVDKVDQVGRAQLDKMIRCLQKRHALLRNLHVWRVS